ncbi:hypothetical protein KUTeg_000430 [Tegillarca granosa]|uniref:Cullin-associated NEDD8-dissociated protein 1 n=1 Tax=Tegillarca granosa TaxID=220873 RepID=A0ABQ9FXM1_TEGGR|nr:hypothetical protein KUTeg_000430 [Tegillarca granosa]
MYFNQFSSFSQQEDMSVQLEALDILGDLLSRFGGYLVMSCNNTLFMELIDFLLTELNKNASTSTTRTYIQCVGAIREEDDELREYCLQAFESFVRRCPKEISPFVQEIVKICLRYICHDPNYNYDEDEDENSMETEDDEDEEEDEDEYSDDDDMSWKVRRAAAKCLDAIIGTRHEMLMEFYKHVSPALIARFKEREENVKADIFHAYITLLRQTRPTLTGDADSMDHDGGDKNSSSNMKIDTLAFLNCVLTHHNPTVFHPHVKVLVPPIVNSVGDPFYKITSEALLVTQQLVKVVRPLDIKVTFDYNPYVRDLYTCTLSRLKAADIDQEVKERAISCMGQIIRNLGDSLSAELTECLPIFLERLKNEITRLTAVKALTMIAGSPLKIDLRTILDEGIPVLASFLRKNQRALKLSTLSCLDVLVRNYGSALTSSMIHEMMKEMPPLINENDLHVSQLTLNLLTSISKIHKSCMATIPNDILPQILILIQSPLLQGGALVALLEFFQALVSIGLPKLGFRDLLQMLITPVYSPLPSHGSAFAVHRQAFHSIAKCVAALTVKCPGEGGNVVNQFVSDVRNAKSSDSIKLFSLLALGEIGKHIDLSSHGEIQVVILESFSSQNEEVKAAASYALELNPLGTSEKNLSIISCESTSKQGVDNLKPYVQTVW